MSRRRILLPLLLAALLVPAIASSAQLPSGDGVLVIAGYDLSGAATWLRHVEIANGAVEILDEVAGDGSDVIAFLDPSASPDGAVVYVAVTEAASGRLFRLDVASGASAPIFDDPTVSYSGLAFSPDGARLAFAAVADGETETDLFVAAPDGSDLVRLTDTPDTSEIEPAWSPDGAMLAYIVEQEPDVSIFVMPADGGEPTLIDTAETPRLSLTWAPDGERLYFVSLTADELGSAIYALPAQGGDAVAVYDPEATSDDAPGLDWLAFSPDGTRLAFVSTTYRFTPAGAVERIQRLNLLTLDTGDIESIPLDWSTTLITGLDWAPTSP